MTTLPWWFWFIPIGIFVIAAGIPLWGWLLKRGDKKDPDA